MLIGLHHGPRRHQSHGGHEYQGHSQEIPLRHPGSFQAARCGRSNRHGDGSMVCDKPHTHTLDCWTAHAVATSAVETTPLMRWDGKRPRDEKFQNPSSRRRANHHDSCMVTICGHTHSLHWLLCMHACMHHAANRYWTMATVKAQWSRLQYIYKLCCPNCREDGSHKL